MAKNLLNKYVWLVETIYKAKRITFEEIQLHSTQKEIERSGEFSIFQLHLCPEFDFQQEVLSMGEDIEVLEPVWLRKEIAGKIKRMWNKYNTNEG